VDVGNVRKKKKFKQKLRSKWLVIMREKKHKKNNVRSVSSELKKWMRIVEFVENVWGNLSKFYLKK
jgi:hypothetical protein